jgi:hypothetical protein
MKSLAVGVSMLCFCLTSFGGNIINYAAPGNLKSTNNLECVGAEKLTNQYTPPDLYKAAEKCVFQSKYNEGVFLFALAGTYGNFDTFRVTDRTAHEAMTVLLMEAFSSVSEEKKAAFEKALSISTTPPALTALCKKIALIGPPNYYPTYMIQHGMGAFIEQGSHTDMVANFDAQAAWEKALATYLHCPGYKNSELQKKSGKTL